MKEITIAVDAMGGDFGPSVIVPASLQMLAKYQNLHLILVGNQEILQNELTHHPVYDQSRITIHHASQRVEMNEPPANALRTKKDSSMRVAINLVKEGKAQACVSAGNTGALMATARFVLKTLPGIDRPAIVSAFPTLLGKNMRMLDLGGNVDSSADFLFQFAVMGSVLTSAVDNIQNPKVYLLNIGEEDIKGNEQVKETARLLSNSSLINYAGFIEGDEIYKGEADVVVCDGFVGNVALKTTEGVVHFVKIIMNEAFRRNFFSKLVGLLVIPVLRSVAKRLDPNRYNGASFVGLRGTVIKSHGGANISAFAHAIEEAIVEVDKNIPQRISDEVARILSLSSKKREGNAENENH